MAGRGWQVQTFQAMGQWWPPAPPLLTLHTTGLLGVLPGSPIRAGPGRPTLLAKPFCGRKCSFFFKQWAPSLRIWVFYPSAEEELSIGGFLVSPH